MKHLFDRTECKWQIPVEANGKLRFYTYGTPPKTHTNFVFESIMQVRNDNVIDIDDRQSFPLSNSGHFAIIKALQQGILTLENVNDNTYISGAWTFVKQGAAIHVFPYDLVNKQVIT